MAKVTVYLPDALHQKVQELSVPISPTCQRALEREVAMTATLSEGMEHITVDMRDKYDERHWSVGFEGRWLVPPDDDNRSEEEGYDAGACFGVALTKRGQIFAYSYHVNNGWPPAYEIFVDLEDAKKFLPGNVVSMAAAGLGQDIAFELDI